MRASSNPDDPPLDEVTEGSDAAIPIMLLWAASSFGTSSQKPVGATSRRSMRACKSYGIPTLRSLV